MLLICARTLAISTTRIHMKVGLAIVSQPLHTTTSCTLRLGWKGGGAPGYKACWSDVLDMSRVLCCEGGGGLCSMSARAIRAKKLTKRCLTLRHFNSLALLTTRLHMGTGFTIVSDLETCDEVSFLQS